MTDKYSERHRVTYYETDNQNRVTIPMLINMAIMVSQDQNNALALTDEFILSFGVTWVVIQYDLDIDHLPKTDEHITLQTQSTSYNKFFAFREFWILDEAGRQCAYIKSLWVAMNVEQRRLAPIPHEIVDPYQSKAVKMTPHLKRPKKIDTVTTSHQYRTRYSDIDTNIHVNNTRYLDWMIDLLPYEFLVSHFPAHINLKYDNEVRYGTMIESNYERTTVDDQIVTKHEIHNNGKIAAVANFTWQNDSEVD
ncbi:acyl-ACP thioesterase domain-containing protein [Lactobacillus sp. Sy-1]|uniref:acyl-[acyl-carrier-protein] thioesterase n=1 Tax=Lactobacillus sp. Sy-1 TaxID=2109645 RepID=UPI001C5B691A|nr:acyl-ACP thioesterase [Lactobacillus sp. Sy-1]